MLATPGLSAGSCAAPALMIRRMLTDGCSCHGIASTCSPFGERLQLIGRKRDGMRRHRARRQLRRPARCADRLSAAAAGHNKQQRRDGGAQAAPLHSHTSRARRLGHDREQCSIRGGEVRLRDALDVRRRHVLEQVEFAIGRLDVVVDHDGVRELQRLLLHGFAPENVVARLTGASRDSTPHRSPARSSAARSVKSAHAARRPVCCLAGRWRPHRKDSDAR